MFLPNSKPMKALLTTAHAVGFALSPLLPVAAGEIIVSREGDAVAVYMRMPFADVAPLFGNLAPGLMDANGEPIFENLFEGTFEGADELAADVGFALGRQDTTFEGLSMMAHVSDTPLPFENPLDAQIAVGVCGVETPEGPIDAADMVWIGGWYAYPIDAAQDLTIAFPATGRDVQTFTVTSFDNWSKTASYEVTLTDGATFTDPYVQRSWLARLFGG